MGEQVAVRIIRTVEEIESIRAAWTCWNTHPHTDVDFYLEHECALPGFARPHIIAINRGGRPAAMMIGKILHAKSLEFPIGPWCPFKPDVRVLRIPSGGLLGNASKENCSIFVREVMTSLSHREADVATFMGLRLDAPMYDFVLRLPSFLVRDPFPEITSHCNASLPSTIEDVYHSLSAKVRWRIRRQAKQLASQYSGDVTTLCFAEHADMHRMMQDVEEVAKKTWQRGLGAGFMDSEEMRRRCDLADRAGWLRTYVLYVAGRPCAFYVGTLYRDIYYLEFTGYDPLLAQYSPGTYLLMRVFDDLCRNNVRHVDFFHGLEEYKQRFGNDRWQEGFVHIYSPSPKGVGLKALRLVTRTAHVLVKGTLQQAGFLKRIRKAWKRYVTPQKLPVSTSQDSLRMNPGGLRK